MDFAIYVDGEGYIGDVSAPNREAAVEFLKGRGYDPRAFEIRELVDLIEEIENER